MSKEALRQLAHVSRATCPSGIAAYIEKHPPRLRAARFLLKFLNMAMSISSDWYLRPDIISHVCREFLRSRRLEATERTVISDYGALRFYLEKLIAARLLPGNTITPPPPNSRDILDEKANKILGYVTLSSAIKAASLEKALEEIEKQIRVHRDAILNSCREIVWAGYKKFISTKDMMNRSDYERILLTPDNLDPMLRNSSGQKISYFSPHHPRGKENLVTYLKNQCSGMYQRRIFPGSHNTHHWGINSIREHLGITEELAVAAMCIIIDELGINVIDLQDAKVQTTKQGEFIKTTESGLIKIRTIKPRAKALIERKANRNRIHPPESSNDIDANTAITILLEMREQHAKAIGSNYLFTLDICSNTSNKSANLYRLQDNRRKSAFHKIISKLPSWVGDADPTMPKIRVSNGVLKYLEDGGNALKASIYLGNTLQTALRNYIPIELQEFIHRKKIRDFQNIVLLISESSSDDFSNPYEIAEDQLRRTLSRLQRSRNSKLPAGAETHIYFLCSKENIELILSYAKFGTDENLRKTCRTVIEKIEIEGSRKMRNLLADAQIREMTFTLEEMEINETAY
ncbi:hypothetical protein LT17_03737 [Pseudomonas aeruginosa]|nr:hypothetical protein [Pseudomonas aeruginosa]KXG14945.1 hypothetical protein LT17_03737 [Pseudomonas aeruginosa]RTR54479.1 hypothetical protein DY931_32070 [Pseudomonas aeruginosa]RTR63990.1 hypothetical protein DY930_34320 [Pseudomonas aeruginosa]